MSWIVVMPGPQAFRSAQQRARAHLRDGALRISGRQGVEQPQLQRQGLETALQQYVVRVVMRVDETRHDELARGFDRPVGGSQVGSDPGDPVTLDQDVGDRRKVSVALVVVDPAAPDQDAGRSVGHILPLFRPTIARHGLARMPEPPARPSIRRFAATQGEGMVKAEEFPHPE